MLLIWKSEQKSKKLPPVKIGCFIYGIYIKICFCGYKQENKKHTQNYFVLFFISNQQYIWSISWFDKDRREHIFDILFTDRTTLLSQGAILTTGSMATGYENCWPVLNFANLTPQTIFQTFVFLNTQGVFCNDWKTLPMSGVIQILPKNATILLIVYYQTNGNNKYEQRPKCITVIFVQVWYEWWIILIQSFIYLFNVLIRHIINHGVNAKRNGCAGSGLTTALFMFFNCWTCNTICYFTSLFNFFNLLSFLS